MGQQIFLPPGSITINEKDIQGDVLIGLQKRAEIFAFFRIASGHETEFKAALSIAAAHLATTEQTRNYEISHGAMTEKVNIAFSFAGLQKLGAADVKKADPSFVKGMRNRLTDLGDKLSDWLPAWKGATFDGVILVAAWDSQTAVAVQHATASLAQFVAPFGGSLSVTHKELGALNAQAPGHEVFGFADGVSQPAVEGLHQPRAADDQSFPGQDIVKLGDFVIGNYDKENGGKATAPAPWMANGSYLVFRRLRQDVNAFDTFTANHFTGIADSAEHLGALMIGRWKDGSPLARDPEAPNAGHDEKQPTENNDFEFGVPKVGQSRCPFSAHIRRVYPRSDVQFGLGNAETRRILRAGIAYDASDEHTVDKGLLFVCYQSSIEEKFEFIQMSWANASSIPFAPPYPAQLSQNMPHRPGIDLIIGQGPMARDVDWTVDKNAGPTRALHGVPKFVTGTGGEYFFSPSISGLKQLAGAQHDV